MLYNSLPWPSWRADIAPDYTIFMPVNAQQSTVYQNTVPAPPNTNNVATNAQQQSSAQEQQPATQTSLGAISQFFRLRNYQSISTTDSVHNDEAPSTTTNIMHLNNG